MPTTISVIVTEVEVDGVTKYLVVDNTSPQRLYGRDVDAGPHDTAAAAETARLEWQRFLERDYRRNPSLG